MTQIRFYAQQKFESDMESTQTQHSNTCFNGVISMYTHRHWHWTSVSVASRDCPGYFRQLILFINLIVTASGATVNIAWKINFNNNIYYWEQHLQTLHTENIYFIVGVTSAPSPTLEELMIIRISLNGKFFNTTPKMKNLPKHFSLLSLKQIHTFQLPEQ